MWWRYLFIIALLLQSIFILNVDGNGYRRRRHRRQTSGSLYGTNAHLGASAPAGFNYPANYNFQGIRLNNPDARNLDLNMLVPYPSYNTGNRLTSVDLNAEPRPQQQQTYGTDNEAVLNYYFSGNSYSSGLAPSFYPSGAFQQAYPANPNQVSSNRGLYGASSNTNNMNNYQYPYNPNNQLPGGGGYRDAMGNSANQLPNSNTYGGPMRSNTNQLANGNSYSGSTGGNRASLIPDSNSYSGYLGTLDNTEAWSNNNYNYNRYSPNTGNSYYPYREMNTNYNDNNRYAYGAYNHSERSIKSMAILLLSLFLLTILHF